MCTTIYISKAAVFSQVGKQTPIACRWSTVGGESGSADTARDPRGISILQLKVQNINL